MNLAMGSATLLPSPIPVLAVSQLHHKRFNLGKSYNSFGRSNLLRVSVCRTVCYANFTPREPAPITYAENEGTLLSTTANIFETINPSGEPSEASITKAEQQVDARNDPLLQLGYLRKPLWLLGPTLLLVTGVVPTLWLPVSSVVLGPSIASLLSLTGLDCIFNLGASLFLLMADSIARPDDGSRSCSSRPPFSYQFWNMVANVAGFIIPLALLLSSQKGFLQPAFPFISFAILLGPYFLLLSVQILTELLTWHWQSPVWLVTPVVYESYRLLQLMRGLKLGAELSAPSWMVHSIRGLVCCWVVVLGMQLMRVAWYAGFTARARQQQADAQSDS